MFSHKINNAPHQPQRAKSMSSVKQGAAILSETIVKKPEKVHQDAYTAANLAYDRAYPNEIVRNRTKRDSREDATNSKLEISRRQSIRFVGPNAVSTKGVRITCREMSNHARNHKFTRGYSTTRLDDTHTATLPEVFDENYVASEPSSYRKLRKTKSMFASSGIPDAISSHVTPRSGRHFQRHSCQISGDSSGPYRVPDPQLKRSFSFVRGVTDRISNGNRQYQTHDAAIQLARDTYLRQLEEQRLKKQPSKFGLGKRHRSQKPFRKSVRTGSTNSCGTIISSSPSTIESKDAKGLVPRAEVLSHAWREKFKRIFKRASNDGVTIPVQHYEARQPHYGDQFLSHNSEHVISPSLSPSPELLHQVEPSSSLCRAHEYSPSNRLNNTQSVNSTIGDISNKSRVTSWTNSTAANTISMPQSVDRKRLSIIDEDGGPHQSLSVVQTCQDVRDGYANFRQPINPRDAGILEPKRIFSALQKQIDENKRKAATDDSGIDNEIDSEQQEYLQPGSWPTRSAHPQSNVRHARTISSINQQYYDLNPSMVDVPKFTTKPQVNDSHPQGPNESSFSKNEQDCEEQEILAPQQIAMMNESRFSAATGPLRETRSAFFPPQLRIERDNTSPFRRAMYSNNNENSVEPIQLANQRAMTSRQPRNGSVAGSESVYSQSSSGRTTEQHGSPVSLTRSESSGGGGTAIIITNRPSPHSSSAKSFFPQRSSSARSSGEWKDFMASEVACLENIGRSRDQAFDKDRDKIKCHQRETCQLHGDDVKVGTLQAPTFVPKQPLGLIQSNIARRPQSLDSRFPLSDAHAQWKGKENALNGPSSNILLQKSSHASLKSRSPSNQSLGTQASRHSPERAERLRRLKRSSVITRRRVPSRQISVGSGHGIDTSSVSIPSQAGINATLVNTFLRDPRRGMRISKEGNNDPAFL